MNGSNGNIIPTSPTNMPKIPNGIHIRSITNEKIILRGKVII